MFQTKVAYKIKTHVLLSVTFTFRKSWRLSDNVGKNCRVLQTTDENMAHAHCLLDSEGYKHTQYIIFISFPQQQQLYDRAHCYVIRTLPVLFIHVSVLLWRGF